MRNKDIVAVIYDFIRSIRILHPSLSSKSQDIKLNGHRDVFIVILSKAYSAEINSKLLSYLCSDNSRFRSRAKAEEL